MQLLTWCFSSRRKVCLFHKADQLLNFFGLSIADLSDQQLRLKLNKVVTAYQSLNKSIKLENGQQKMNLFLCKHVDLETAQALSTSSFVQPPATPSASNTRCAAFTVYFTRMYCTYICKKKYSCTEAPVRQGERGACIRETKEQDAVRYFCEMPWRHQKHARNVGKCQDREHV